MVIIVTFMVVVIWVVGVVLMVMFIVAMMALVMLVLMSLAALEREGDGGEGEARGTGQHQRIELLAADQHHVAPHTRPSFFLYLVFSPLFIWASTSNCSRFK